MKISRKIVFLWLALLATYVISLALLPHRDSSLSSVLNRSIQSLLFFISLFIFLKEPNKKNKFIFLNFLVFYALSVVQFGYDFVGLSFFTKEKYATHLYAQYFSIAYILFFSISVLYLVIDLLFRDFKVYQKYLASCAIVLMFFGYYFHPFFSDPLYLYSTEEIKQWKTLATGVHIEPGAELPTTAELANKVKLQAWRDGYPVGDLYPDQNLKRIEELTPYLEGDSYKVLLWKPIYYNMIYMNVMLIGFVLLFFGYQYKKDPPQGAYIDKIMFLYLLFASTDILHQWGYIKSVELSSLTELFSIGQYITVAIQLMIVLFFGLRLRFITSVQGEFYESELASNPQQVSRWRDWVDNIVLAHFFNFKLFNGRLFQNPNVK